MVQAYRRFHVDDRSGWLPSLAAAGAAHILLIALARGTGIAFAAPSLRAPDARIEAISLELVSEAAPPGGRESLSCAEPIEQPKLRAHARSTRHWPAQRVALPQPPQAPDPSRDRVANEGSATRDDTPLAASGHADPVLSSAGLAVQKPRLLPDPDLCAGLFPRLARDDHGAVLVELQVTRTGTARSPRVLSELPAGQGFADAARSCAGRLRFAPGLDGAGSAVAAASVVRLHFARGSR